MTVRKYPHAITAWRSAVLVLSVAAAFSVPALAQDDEKVYPEGYSDTPKLPNSQWKVHDIDRPRPVVVMPGKTAADAPSDAIILFDGTDLAAWHGEKESEDADGKKQRSADKDAPAKWKVESGYVEMTPTGNIYTKESFGDCQLHIEWSSPAEPRSNSQHRGNSGIFLMDRYEIQVLDCYNNKTYADGQAGAAYGQSPPLVNATRKPGEWQTYDIIFRAPLFKEGKLESPATVTILLNGVLVQNHFELLGATTHRAVGTYSAHPDKAPIRLQDHNDKQAVRYRNIWVRPL